MIRDDRRARRHPHSLLFAIGLASAVALGGCGGSAPDPGAAGETQGPEARLHQALEVGIYTIDENAPNGPVAERIDLTLLQVFELGREDAPIVLVEIADVRCPWCARSWEGKREVMDQLLEEGRIRTVFVDFPLPSHPESPELHSWARCLGSVAGPETFWAARDELYRRQAEIQGPEDLGAFVAALDLGRRQEDVDICVQEGLELHSVQLGVQIALGLGVRGTPMYFVGGLPVSGVLAGDYLLSIVERLETSGADEILEAAGVSVR